MPVTPTNNTTFQNVLNAGKNIAAGTATLVGAVGLTAKTVALVAGPVFAKFATSALGGKLAGSTVVAILGGPIGWGLFGLAALIGTAYFGYKVYQAYQDHKKEEEIFNLAFTPVTKIDPRNNPNANVDKNRSLLPNSTDTTAGNLSQIEEDDDGKDVTIPENLKAKNSLNQTSRVTKHVDPRNN